MVCDGIGDNFYHQREYVSGNCHSQSIPWSPLLGITRHEENSNAEDQGDDYNTEEGLKK